MHILNILMRMMYCLLSIIDNAAMTFKATQMPDSDTKAVFKVVVRYLNVNGNVASKDIYVKVTKSLVDGVVYERNS